MLSKEKRERARQFMDTRRAYKKLGVNVDNCNIPKIKKINRLILKIDIKKDTIFKKLCNLNYLQNINTCYYPEIENIYKKIDIFNNYLTKLENLKFKILADLLDFRTNAN